MTSDAPVSVIVPTRDRPELLRRAIRGMLQQDTRLIREIVVVFDQTKVDSTLSSLTREISIATVTNDRTPGLAGARNTGILASRSEWIAFCDDDDVWAPQKLGRQWAAAQSDDSVDFLVGSIIIAHGDRRIPRRTGRESISIGDLIRNRLPAAHPSTFLVKRSAIDSYLGLVDERLPGSYAEDYDWLIRAARERPIVAVRDVRPSCSGTSNRISSIDGR